MRHPYLLAFVLSIAPIGTTAAAPGASFWLPRQSCPVMGPRVASVRSFGPPTTGQSSPPPPSSPSSDPPPSDPPPSSPPPPGELSGPPPGQSSGPPPSVSPSSAAAPAPLLPAAPDSTTYRPPQAEVGPLFQDEGPSDTAYKSNLPGRPPRFSVGKGVFCFVEDAKCSSALLASVDVAAGVNVITGDNGVDIPYAHYAFRGGFTVRPITLAKRRWHPWSIGLVGSWSRGTGAVSVLGSLSTDDQTVERTQHTDAWRVALVNQLWLSRKANALHVDLTLGMVRSTVLTTGLQLFGSHAEAAIGWGGWGSLFLGADFLDQDTRAVMGVRAHAIVAAPIVLLVALGLLAGGAL